MALIFWIAATAVGWAFSPFLGCLAFVVVIALLWRE